MLHDRDDWRDDAKDRRGSHRVPVAAPAAIASSALGRIDATVVDLSQTGCRILTRARCHRGEHVVVTIASLGPRASVAAWRGDGELGLAFAQPLSWTVVATIAGHLAG